MGTKKISQIDIDVIVRHLRHWPTSKKLCWESLRKSLAIEAQKTMSFVWSRQSLSANETIYIAFTNAKERLLIARKTCQVKTENFESYEKRIIDLTSEVNELKNRYERLLLRHTQFCYNASLLEKGSFLLDSPLPDNTRSQKG